MLTKLYSPPYPKPGDNHKGYRLFNVNKEKFFRNMLPKGNVFDIIKIERENKYGGNENDGKLDRKKNRTS